MSAAISATAAAAIAAKQIIAVRHAEIAIDGQVCFDRVGFHIRLHLRCQCRRARRSDERVAVEPDVRSSMHQHPPGFPPRPPGGALFPKTGLTRHRRFRDGYPLAARTMCRRNDTAPRCA